MLANLVSASARSRVTYQPDLEQLLVLLPPDVRPSRGSAVANRNTKQALQRRVYLSFNLNLNLPPPCTTGFLPAQQLRPPSLTDYPTAPAGDTVLPDSAGLADRTCAAPATSRARPGRGSGHRRSKMCESDEDYVPLNDGYNWKGDPNATLTGQAVPQPPPGTPGSTAVPPPAAAPPPIAAAEYDPATGSYMGPDGKTYTQANLAHDASEGQTWRTWCCPRTATEPSNILHANKSATTKELS